LHTTRKDTQRDRLLRGMTHVATHEGYTETTVAKVIARAGVSRPTFYDYFTNREDCFLAALAGAQEQALTEIRRAVENKPAEQVARTTIAAMVGFASSRPALARMMMVQALTGVPNALDARDRTIEAIAEPIEAALSRMPNSAFAPDLSARVTIGAVERLLAARLNRDMPMPPALLGDCLAWTQSYERPIREHRWRPLRPVTPPASSPLATRLAAPPPLPPGRPRLSREDVEANHRRRILLAAARASVEKGYAATTVAEIAALASVDGRVFHRLFRDKRELLEDLFELSFQHVMTVTAGAFFAADDWPSRVWDAGRTFAQCLEQNPTLAHIAFIETYAGGQHAARRAEGFLNAFTLFLRDDSGHGPQPVDERGRGLTPPSRVALDAIAAAIFEIVYRQVRASPTPELSGLLPHVTNLTLAPFLGSDQIDRFADQKLTAEDSSL
jgi:AcrR family transcriptional regulator